MDVVSNLAVRFHFNGEFKNYGKKVHYVGGREQLVYIDRDKISLPEIVGHLKDYCNVGDGTLLHWLFPGKDMNNGLRVLVDDKACQDMSDAIIEGGVAEIYAEKATDDEAGEGSNFEDELEAMDVAGSAADLEDAPGGNQQENVAAHSQSREDVDSSGSDSDYLPGDDCSSEEDEEAVQILKKFKEIKKKIRGGQRATLDDIVLEGANYAMPVGFEYEDDGNETSYADTSDDEDSLDEQGVDGEIGRKQDFCPRYKKTNGVPQFQLGMKFRGKKQFKKAIIRYGLADRRVINFVKDDTKRVRAKCDWEHCPWLCLLSKNSRSESWQIVTFHDFHTCPPRRDNRLVTARTIAEKYEKFIIANPSWSFVSMKQTVQEEMFADVSISKLKRAKGMVMQKALDAMKGQYQRLYDYQLELLRSNPGSTVIVHKEKDVAPPTFYRMYICLDALKKGFIAGCRKVVGLDGCFFKGATTGELLCAIGRDANNQMYPIAWAVVDKETNESWDWFCDLLCKDLHVGDGTDWVFISDQQKGVLNAVEKWAPAAEHRNCARHIYANWKKEFGEKEYQKKKECSCRYWQLSGLPCPHAISCIFFKTNSLEDYIANCYSVEEFKKTYSYFLEPVEGMNSWPVSDRPKLKAPGYIRMPGRPKKERRREATEPPKGSRMSKVGTVIRCTKCKQTGHNRSTCERHATASASATAGSQSIAPPNAIANAQSSTQQSYTSTSRKRKAPGGPLQITETTINTTARARVATGPGGNASVTLVANVPRLEATSTATINITSGKASAKVSASVPTPPKQKKSKPNQQKPGPMLLLPPWASDKL